MRKSVIDWDKSYLLTAEQVNLLGLLGTSVNDLDTSVDVPDVPDVPNLARLADAMNRLTVVDPAKWKEQFDA